LVDTWEVEGEVIEARLGDLLFSGVCELRFKPSQEVEVSIFHVVVNGVELFKAFKDAFDPTVYLGSFDKHERDCDAPYRGFKAWYSLVGHYVYLKFPNEGVGSGSVAIEE